MKSWITIALLLIAMNSYTQPSGSLDPTFGNNGQVITSITNSLDKAHSVVIQPDEKIIVAGESTSSVSGKDFTCVRYLSDGTLDAAFGNGGIVTTDLQLGSEDVAYSVALQADGKIILAGYSDDGSEKDAALIRYTSAGKVDSTFGTNGRVLTDFDNTRADEIRVVKIHALTGNIIVGGSATINSALAKPVVARYLSNGSIDNSFNNNGIRLLWIDPLDDQYVFSVEDLSVQPNGKITAAGWREFPNLQWESDYWAARINADGLMDPTFSADGVNTYNGGFNGHDRAFSMLLKPDNSLIVAGGGYVSNIKYDFFMFEIDAGGSSGWTANADYGTLLDDIAYGLMEDSKGRYILGGSSGNASDKSFALARFNANASSDATFGTDGQLTTTFGNNALNECFALTVQSDDKIIAVGYSGNDFAIARYLGESQAQLDDFQLLSPADQATDQDYWNLAFDWTSAFGATSYEIKIDSSETFSSNPQTFTSNSSDFFIIDLAQSTAYYWQVRASDGTNWGNWSPVWKLTTNAQATSTIDPALLPLKVYPNPTEEILHLEVDNSLIGSTYTIIDNLGKIVKSGQLQNTLNKLSLENLVPGIYFLKIDDQLKFAIPVRKR